MKIPIKKLASNTDEKRSKLSITTAKRISKKPRVHKRKGNKSETSSLKKGQSNSSFFNESESLKDRVKWVWSFNMLQIDLSQ